ncbi:MAG: outer membrane beta-barrel protein [Bacteroidota bacterium]
MKKLTFTLLTSLVIVLGINTKASAFTDFNIDAALSHPINVEVKDSIKPSKKDTSKKDTTNINFKKKKIRITSDEEGTSIDVKRDEWQDSSDFNNDDGDFNFDFGKSKENFDIHWAGFEFGINNYLNEDFSMILSDQNDFMELNTSKSWNINLNFIEYEVPIIKENFGIGTGMGFEFNDYRFDNLSPIKKDNDQIVRDSSYENLNVEKAKLTTTYITVPILFEYQTPVNEDSKFFITAGVIGGVKIGSHTKVVYNEDGDRKKEKNRGDFYLSPLRYGYTVKMGYGFLKVFANYYETPLFQKDKGPKLHPFTVGFSLSF